MDTRLLQKVDMNLLLVLQVMLEERNVSKAAERLFITQPAVSKALGRLRDLFKDPLFTRTAHGMLPTPRAQEIGIDLGSVLHNVERLVSPQGFDPTNSDHAFAIAIPGFIGQGFLPPLMEQLAREAPNVQVQAIPGAEHQLERLTEGSLDIAFHAEYRHYGPEFIVRKIGSTRSVLMMREGHPGLAEADNPAVWQHYPRVRLHVPDVNELMLFRVNRDASFGRVVFETPHTGTALEVLRRTDCVMAGPPFVLQNERLSHGVTSLRVPLLEESEVRFNLVRHRRTSSSPAHIWFWQKLVTVIEQVTGVQKTRFAAGQTPSAG